MTITKSGLVREVKGELGLRTREARVIVEAVFGEIMAAVLRGERVELRGVGTFLVKSSRPRWARDFARRRAIRLSGGARLSFKVSRKLRGKLNAAAVSSPPAGV